MSSDVAKDSATTAAEMVEWLSGEVPATGRVVVCLDLALRTPQRLEVDASENRAAFSEKDRRRLLDALDAAGNTEGWVAAEVDYDGAWGTMVWHVVGHGAHPLTASHARAVLISFDRLILPTGTNEDQAVDGTRMGG